MLFSQKTEKHYYTTNKSTQVINNIPYEIDYKVAWKIELVNLKLGTISIFDFESNEKIEADILYKILENNNAILYELRDDLDMEQAVTIYLFFNKRIINLVSREVDTSFGGLQEITQKQYKKLTK
jgi:hypothetical protein